MFTNESAVVWIVVVAQLIGLGSAGLARLMEGSASQMLSQALFLMALLIVGGVTAVTLSSGNAAWLFAAATLPVMAVGATIDLQGSSVSY